MLKFNTLPILGNPISITNKNLCDNKNLFDDIEYCSPAALGTRISKDSFILNDNKYKNIKQNIIEVVEDYKKNVLSIKNELIMTQSWVSLNNKDNQHHTHTHGNTFISLVYYLNCVSGDLVFDFEKSSIQKGFYFDYDVEEFNIYNSSSWTFNVKTDDIVIFPGLLKHRTTPNQDTKYRKILGANFFLKGKLGKYDEYSEITL